jgi:hypothetical protein
MGTFLLGVLFTICVMVIITIGILTLSILKLKKQLQVALSDCRNDDLLIHKRIDGEIDRTNELYRSLLKEIMELRTKVITEPEIDSSVKEKKKKRVQ